MIYDHDIISMEGETSGDNSEVLLFYGVAAEENTSAKSTEWPPPGCTLYLLPNLKGFQNL